MVKSNESRWANRRGPGSYFLPTPLGSLLQTSSPPPPTGLHRHRVRQTGAGRSRTDPGRPRPGRIPGSRRGLWLRCPSPRPRGRARCAGVRQANWCQWSRWKSGRRERFATTLHPESWSDAREGGGQALTGARVGGAIEHRKADDPGCRGSFCGRRQHPNRRFWRGGRNPAVSKNPCTHVRTAPGPGRSSCHPAVVAGSLREGL